jgi:hypothetical protein
VYTPQLAGVLSARATLDVLNTIAAVTLTSAHANSKQPVIILISFVFIFMFLSSDVFLFWPSLAAHYEESFLAVQ